MNPNSSNPSLWQHEANILGIEPTEAQPVFLTMCRTIIFYKGQCNASPYRDH